MAADVEQMYRQMLVKRFLWRENPSQPIKDYRLEAVTYGSSCGYIMWPYLVIETLRQLSIYEKVKYPEASKIVLSGFYVDDLLTDAESNQTLLYIRNETAEHYP